MVACSDNPSLIEGSPNHGVGANLNLSLGLALIHTLLALLLSWVIPYHQLNMFLLALLVTISLPPFMQCWLSSNVSFINLI